MTVRTAVCFAAAVLAAGLAVGCQTGRPAFAPLEAALSGFSEAPHRSGIDAVGRLERTSGEGFWKDFFTEEGCTAFLVDRDKIMTAAHCVMKDRGKNGELHSPGDFVFSARENQKIKSNAVEFLYVGGFHWDGMNSIGRSFYSIGRDIALLRLEEPLGAQLGWLRRGKVDWNEIAAGGEYQAAGFSNGHWNVLHGCRLHPEMAEIWKGYHPSVHSAFAKGVLFHTCAMRPGASGGPLLREENGALTWIGVHSVWFAEFTDRGFARADQVGLSMILQPDRP